MKKLMIAAVMAIAAVSAFAQQATGKGPDFKNRTSTGIVKIDTTNNTTEFAGLYNNTSVELLSGKVDCGIDATFGLIKPIAKPIQFTDMTINDWYIEFRPFEKFTFALNDRIYTHGSYLPVLGTNIDNGNIGSDIVVVWRPIQGMRIGFGYDIPSFFGQDNDGNEAHPVFNFGADYTYGNKFSVGFSIRDLINNIGVGIYGEVLAVDNLYVTYGYAYNNGSADYYGVSGTHLISLGTTYKYKKATFGLDFLTNCVNTGADFYIGANTKVAATDAVTVGLKFQTAIDADDSNENKYEINADVSYAAKAWGCGAGVDVELGKATVISFPVYFEFSL